MCGEMTNIRAQIYETETNINNNRNTLTGMRLSLFLLYTWQHINIYNTMPNEIQHEEKIQSNIVL